VAYRSRSRPSSTLGAKASTMRPYYLDGDLAQHSRPTHVRPVRRTFALNKERICTPHRTGETGDLAGPGDTRYRPPLIDGGRFVASVQFSRTVERR
jgi:hypothetical protein